jgi:hypothetical protein
MKKIIAATLFALLPAAASADGFYTRDLGSGGHYEACVERARQAIQMYANQNGTPNATVNTGSWSAHGFDLMPGETDVQIACPYRDNMSDIVLLTVHNRDSRDDRITVVEGIAALWDQLEGGGGGAAPTK